MAGRALTAPRRPRTLCENRVLQDWLGGKGSRAAALSGPRFRHRRTGEPSRQRCPGTPAPRTARGEPHRRSNAARPSAEGASCACLVRPPGSGPKGAPMPLRDTIPARRSRRGFLKAAALGSAAVALPPLPVSGQERAGRTLGAGGQRLRPAVPVRGGDPPCARRPLRAGGRQPDPAPGPRRRHHPVGPALRAAPRRHSGHRSGRASGGRRRSRRPAAGVHDGRAEAVAGGHPRLLHRVLGQRPREVVSRPARHRRPRGRSA